MNFYTTFGLDPAQSPQDLNAILGNHYTSREASGFLPGEAETILIAKAILGDPLRRNYYDQALATGNPALATMEKLQDLASRDPQSLVRSEPSRRDVGTAHQFGAPQGAGAQSVPGQGLGQPEPRPVAGQSFGQLGTDVPNPMQDSSGQMQWNAPTAGVGVPPELQNSKSKDLSSATASVLGRLRWPLDESEHYKSRLWVWLWGVALVVLAVMSILALAAEEVSDKMSVAIFAIPGLILLLNEFIWAVRRSAGK